MKIYKHYLKKCIFGLQITVVVSEVAKLSRDIKKRFDFRYNINRNIVVCKL